MTRRIHVSILSTAGLAATLAATSHADDCDCGQSNDTRTLTAVVHDMHEAHPDFEVQPSGGPGVYAGNLDIFIRDHKPTFVGPGKKVLTTAKDNLGRPIAPHLANHSFLPGVDVPPQATSVILKDSKGVDAYQIDFISAEFDLAGHSTWTYHVQELPTGKDLSHWNLALDPSHQVLAGTTPGYDLGVDGSTGFYGIKWDVSDGFSEGTFVIVLDNTYLGADMGTSVLAKGGNAPDVGALFAPTGIVATSGSPYNGGGALVPMIMGDTPATYGVSSTGGITSSETFDQWYHDQPGVNLSAPLEMTLTLNEECVWVFDDMAIAEYISLGGFFPIDGELLGNSGGLPAHNYHFTVELHAEFTYDADGEQFLLFSGEDDAWVFIGGKLAIDLGGVHSTASQFVDLGRMGLIDGETYEIELFFAERHRVGSHFRLETNLCLESVEIPTITASYD